MGKMLVDLCKYFNLLKLDVLTVQLVVGSTFLCLENERLEIEIEDLCNTKYTVSV